VFFGSDHVETFSVTCVPTFAIIAGSRAVAQFAGRKYNVPVHREMAEDLLGKLVVEKDFDMAYSEDAELGHAFAVRSSMSSEARHPDRSVFYQRLRSAAADAETVRGVGEGGRRHHQGTEGTGRHRRQRRDVAFSRHEKISAPGVRLRSRLVSQFEAGNTDALLNMTGTQLDEVGNTEMLNWATMFGRSGVTKGSSSTTFRPGITVWA